MTTASELDQRIQIVRETHTPDGVGGFDVTTSQLLERWAKMRPLRGSERDENGQIINPHGYSMRIRNDAEARGVTESDRVVWRGVEYNIRSISSPGERFLWLDIEIERGVAQ